MIATSWQVHANSAGPPPCGVIAIAPRVQQVPEVVPSNAPAFALARSFDSRQHPRLFDDAEREIGVVRTKLDSTEVYVAASALREGQYVVEFGGPCEGSPRERVPFRVGGPVPFPKTSGKLSIETVRRLEGSADVEIAVAVEPETVAYASYSRLSFGAVGMPEFSTEFGSAAPRERPIVPIRVTCGSQRLQVEQRIAGLDESAIAPAELAVDVDCANDTVRVAGKEPIPIAAAAPPAEAGGCQVGPGRASGGVVAFGLVLACAAIVRRRKRA